MRSWRKDSQTSARASGPRRARAPRSYTVLLPVTSRTTPRGTGGMNRAYSQKKAAQSTIRSRAPVLHRAAHHQRARRPLRARWPRSQPGSTLQWSSRTAIIAPLRRAPSPCARRAGIGGAGLRGDRSAPREARAQLGARVASPQRSTTTISAAPPPSWPPQRVQALADGGQAVHRGDDDGDERIARGHGSAPRASGVRGSPRPRPRPRPGRSSRGWAGRPRSGRGPARCARTRDEIRASRTAGTAGEARTYAARAQVPRPRIRVRPNCRPCWKRCRRNTAEPEGPPLPHAHLGHQRQRAARAPEAAGGTPAPRTPSAQELGVGQDGVPLVGRVVARQVVPRLLAVAAGVGAVPHEVGRPVDEPAAAGRVDGAADGRRRRGASGCGGWPGPSPAAGVKCAVVRATTSPGRALDAQAPEPRDGEAAAGVHPGHLAEALLHLRRARRAGDHDDLGPASRCAASDVQALARGPPCPARRPPPPRPTAQAWAAAPRRARDEQGGMAVDQRGRHGPDSARPRPRPRLAMR